MKQAELDQGQRKDGLGSAERVELVRLRRENGQLKLEREILSNAAWLAGEANSVPAPVFEFVRAHQGQYPVATMCRALGVSTSGYYAGRQRPPSRRAVQDQELSAKIGQIHEQSRQSYGARRVHAELRARGQRVSRRRVKRLMRALGVQRVPRRKP